VERARRCLLAPTASKVESARGEQCVRLRRYVGRHDWPGHSLSYLASACILGLAPGTAGTWTPLAARLPGTRHFQQGRPLCLRVRCAPGGGVGALLASHIIPPPSRLSPPLASRLVLFLLLLIERTPVAGSITTPAIFLACLADPRTSQPFRRLAQRPSSSITAKVVIPCDQLPPFLGRLGDRPSLTVSDRHHDSSKRRLTRPATMSRPSWSMTRQYSPPNTIKQSAPSRTSAWP